MLSGLERLSNRLEKATIGLTVIGGLCLLGMVVVVTAGVVSRYVFGAPLLGVNEIVELNGLSSPDEIFVGMTLKIPAK